MNTTDKFLADIQRVIKHERADNGGRYDAKRACTRIADLFASNNRDVQDLARSIADYWLNTYVLASADLANEPGEENKARLTAFQNFLDGENDADYSVFTADDWETLRDFANDEAETMDLDRLQNMMSLILEHGAL